MPIAKVVGIQKRNWTKKETGELKESVRIHYQFNLNGKGDNVGVGADNVSVNTDKFDAPTEIGSMWLIEKDGNGFLENLEYISPPTAPKAEK